LADNQFNEKDFDLFSQPATPANGAAAPQSKPAAAQPSSAGSSGSSQLPSNGSTGGTVPPYGGSDEHVALAEATQVRYLNYALSVITSRALPDVRDGMKPVQRRILYTMWQQGVTFDAKHRKCATVVGAVMGNYHPHGDQSIYDALVRLAQPFAMRVPLIDGSGNFGSLDGDNAAAMRYTECRLQRISDEILGELDQQTVPFRPNYDGTKFEPVVLPAKVPQLLLNGSMGIAVGMATNIPPHNLEEVCKGLLRMLDNQEISTAELCRTIKGPDFPTGGQILNSSEEIKKIYKEGSGTIRVRGTWEDGPSTRTTKTIYITSVPYNVNKSTLVEEIGQVVISRKLPPLLDVKDISTTDVRVELTLKKEADEQMIMAYLFKHTPLQSNFSINMTCLVPTDNPEVGRPERLELREVLWHFLQFRLQVVTKRLEHELGQLNKRIHVLEGFEKVFDALDEILKIIRASDGKADAAGKIMKRFDLDDEQTDAILELKLYRLAKLEINIVRKELAEKRKRANEITRLLNNESGRWNIVKDEVQAIIDQYAKLPGFKRQTSIGSDADEKEYSAEDFIVDEDNAVIVTKDGWLKRQKEVKDINSTRLREGDSVLAVIHGSTRASVAFFTNFGICYSCRIIDIPATTGHGDPIQSLFKFKDGEKVLFAVSLDPRVTKDYKSKNGPTITQESEGASGGTSGRDRVERLLAGADTQDIDIPKTHALAVTSDGYALRFSLEPFSEPSTKAGRKYARPADGAEVIGVTIVNGSEIIIAATRYAHAMLCKASEVNFLSGAGKGVILVKLSGTDDRVIGFIASVGDRDLLRVETARGGEQTISTTKYEVVSRGGKGREIMKRGELTRVITEAPTAPEAPK
jgi:DNA gyrase subunit A